MLTFQQEHWPDFVEEIKPLLSLQWGEIALDHDEIPLDPDWERYADADAKGQLKTTTVRDGKKLVGWYASIVTPHPHYKSTLFAFLDLYYILPKYRTAINGMRLFVEMEKSMRALGVKEMISITKMHHNVAPLFERLGWRETGITFTKVLR